MENRYRVCLIGCGRMGATIDDEVRDRLKGDLFLPYSHAAAIAACGRVEFAGVCDPIAEKAGAARERYGARQSFTDYETMIREVQPDIVCIATRPSAHAPASIFAAEQGVRGIYCEKPLCNSMVEADAMLQALDTRGVKFNYGTQRRYVSLYRNLRAMTDAGDIGEVQAVIAHCGSSAAQWGHTHTADMLLFLSGDGEVEFLQGAAEIDDMVSARGNSFLLLTLLSEEHLQMVADTLWRVAADWNFPLSLCEVNCFLQYLLESDETALDLAERGLKMRPESIICGNVRALLLNRAGQVYYADEQWRQTLLANPGSSATYMVLGHQSICGGSLDVALRYFQEACILGDNPEEAERFLAAAMECLEE